MPRKLSYEEKFERLKNDIKQGALNDFLIKYQLMKDIEEGLLKEQKDKFEGVT